MNIGQGTHEMAPPAGVEPTTYRLGGSGPSRPNRVDPTVNPFSIRLITLPLHRPISSKKSKARQALLDKLSQPALLSDRIQPLRRPTLRLKQRGRIDRECLIGLGIVLLIFAGAAALYWAPQPAPPALNRCPTHEVGNPWCGP